MIKTKITEMFGCRYPIIAAPMFLVSNVAMVNAVGRAGGIGTIPSLNYWTNEDFRKALTEIDPNIPYGVNIIVHQNPRYEEDLQACIDAKTPLIISSLGDPTETVKKMHKVGARVFCDVINLKHGKKAADAGADALITVCHGAGGHAGTIAQNVLIPWLKKELRTPPSPYPLPLGERERERGRTKGEGILIVGAGGLATGAGLAAVLALGADAGYFGTRFIASTEAAAKDAYKQMIVDSTPEDIEYTPEVSGHNANFMKKSLSRYRELGPKAEKWVDAWSAGQAVGLIDKIKPCAEIVSDIAREYTETLSRLPR